jgi:ferredoxin--NADP+ reductase
VGGKSQFACVDGPEFDAREVDFNVLMRRNRMYRDAEKRSLEEYQNRLKGGGESEAEATCLVGGGKQ